MVTFLSGGTGTPKLLDGATTAFTPAETTVVANTGDDVELGGLFVSPDVDTLLFQGGGILDRDTWWGIENDTHRTHDALADLAEAAGRSTEPTYLPEERQTAGRDLANDLRDQPALAVRRAKDLRFVWRPCRHRALRGG